MHSSWRQATGVLAVFCAAGSALAGCGSKSPTSPTAADVRSVTVALIATAGAYQGAAVAAFSDGSSREVTAEADWSSTNPSVATVSPSGQVTTVSPGTAEIRAAYRTIVGGAALTVSAVPSPQPTPTPSPTPTPTPSPSPAPSPTPAPVPSPALGNGVVINEFASRTSDDQSSGEFVELRNDSPNPVDISGWRIVSQLGQDSSGSIVTWHTVEAGRVLGSGCHYLAGSSTYAGNSWAVPTDARSVFNGINDNSGIALVRPDGSIADQVGMRSNTIYREGTPLAAFNFNSGRSSYARMAPDTDNNAADFQFQSGHATPENASSSCAIR